MPNELETKLAEREKAGWEFVGQVTVKLDKGSVPALIFREKAKGGNRFDDRTSGFAK